MNVEKKKKELKKIVLNSKHNYNLLVYHILSTDCLDKIIAKIDDIPVVSNVNSKEIISADEQFVALLNRFINFFEQTFSNVHCYTELFIQNIILTNEKEMSKYLLSKHYLGDNKYIKYFNKTIYGIIVCNFLKNARYLRSLTKFFHDNYINVDKKRFSLNEILLTKELMSRIVFCNNEIDLLFFFTSIDYTIKYHLKIEKRKKSEIEEEIINHYSIQYSTVMSEYYKKEEYIKYFRD